MNSGIRDVLKGIGNNKIHLIFIMIKAATRIGKNILTKAVEFTTISAGFRYIYVSLDLIYSKYDFSFIWFQFLYTKVRLCSELVIN
jgi:hypothetical protein